MKKFVSFLLILCLVITCGCSINETFLPSPVAYTTLDNLLSQEFITGEAVIQIYNEEYSIDSIFNSKKNLIITGKIKELFNIVDDTKLSALQTNENISDYNKFCVEFYAQQIDKKSKAEYKSVNLRLNTVGKVGYPGKFEVIVPGDKVCYFIMDICTFVYPPKYCTYIFYCDNSETVAEIDKWFIGLDLQHSPVYS